MKNLKIVFLLFTLLLTSALIWSCQKEPDKVGETSKNLKNTKSLVVRGLNDCVPPELETPTHPCYNTSMYTITTNLTLPQYPNCTFTVEIDVRICYDYLGRPVNYLIFDWRWINNIFDCSDLLNDAIAAYQNNNFTSFITLFDNRMLIAIENYFIQQAIQSGGSAFYYCGSSTPLNIGYYQSGCYRFCMGTDANNQWAIRKTLCGTNCCQRITEMCINPQTGQIVKTTTVTSLGSCTSITPQSGWCNLNNATTTDCIQLCEQ